MFTDYTCYQIHYVKALLYCCLWVLLMLLNISVLTFSCTCIWTIAFVNVYYINDNKLLYLYISKKKHIDSTTVKHN